MAKLIIELQKDCVNSTVSYTVLFQKAYFIAKKLNQQIMIDFLRKEIDGYKKVEDVPSFRYLDVVYKAKNVMLGRWIPVIIPYDNPLKEYLRMPAVQSVSEMESFLNSDENTLIMSISAELQSAFIALSRDKIPLEICAHFSKNQYKTILETGKRMISDWAIDLERNGMLGEEYEFSTDEKEKARNMSITNNFYAPINGANIVGTATNSTLNVNNTNSFDYEGVEKLLESVQKLLPAGNFAKDDLIRIQQNMDEIKESISKQDVPAVKGKLKDLADFCKGIAGNVIASGVWAQIQPLLQ